MQADQRSTPVRRWLLAPASETPLRAFRISMGIFLMVYFSSLVLMDLDGPRPHGVLDLGAARAELPLSRVSLLLVPALRDCAWLLWAIAAAAAATMTLGWATRSAAWVVFIACLSTVRAWYPLTTPVDRLALHLSFWGALALFAGRGIGRDKARDIRASGRFHPARLTVACCLVSTLLLALELSKRGHGAFPATLGCAFGCLLLGLSLAGAAPDAPARLSGSAVVAAAISFLLMLVPLAEQVGAHGFTRTVAAVLQDVGASAPTPDDRSVTRDLRARLQDGREVALTALWPSLPRATQAWAYAVTAPAALGEPRRTRLRLQGAIREGLATTACERSPDTGQVDVLWKGEVVFGFHCQRDSARLSVVPVVPVVSEDADTTDAIAALQRKVESGFPTSSDLSRFLLANRDATGTVPLAVTLRVADLRFMLREYDEAARLVELAYARASPEVRQRAGLSGLRQIVLAKVH